MAPTARITSLNLAIETEQTESFQSQTHCHELIQRLQSRRNLSDVVLIVGQSGKRIEAHRLILIACSDYFSDLLSEPMRDVQQREVALSEVDEGAMEKLINYCYTGSLELEGDTIGALLVTANLLRFEKVAESCCEYLARHLQPNNSLAVAFLAEQLSLEKLLRDSRKFICENFEDVSKHPDFLFLNSKQLSKFIANDDLCAPSEEFVFEVLMKWIEYEPETRKKHFTELLAHIRLSQLPPDFLSEKVEPLCNTMESKDLILNALKSHLQVTSNSTQPRKYSKK